MNRLAILIAAVLTAVFVLINITLGRNLIMPLRQAQEFGVGTGPWMVVWGMIAVTALCSLALIAYVVSTLRRPSGR